MPPPQADPALREAAHGDGRAPEGNLPIVEGARAQPGGTSRMAGEVATAFTAY